jgi:flavin-dependent dehydrogenase
MKSYDTIIIGAGVSGLCIGSLLAKKGREVLILEKAPVVGGRYQSINYKNHAWTWKERTWTRVSRCAFLMYGYIAVALRFFDCMHVPYYL